MSPTNNTPSNRTSTPGPSSHLTSSSVPPFALLPSIQPRIARARRTTAPKTYPCLTCATSFSRKFDLEKHVLTVHKHARPYTCPTCAAAFGQKYHVTRHISAVHAKRKAFACTCGKSFSRPEHLRSHKASVHARARMHPCALCAARYADTRELITHIVARHKVTHEMAGILAAGCADGKLCSA